MIAGGKIITGNAAALGAKAAARNDALRGKELGLPKIDELLEKAKLQLPTISMGVKLVGDGKPGKMDIAEWRIRQHQQLSGEGMGTAAKNDAEGERK
ncbi:MAG: hypothetical protein WC759_03085 [Candidatus Micrarchaeia archaeon]|jgi:hypothetical protein